MRIATTLVTRIKSIWIRFVIQMAFIEITPLHMESGIYMIKYDNINEHNADDIILIAPYN